MLPAMRYSDTGAKDLPILFFVHGWPDTKELWKNQVAYFSGRFRCVCVDLPGFAAEEQGHDFPVLIDRLQATIDEVRQSKSQPVIFVGHDWGAYLAYLFDQKFPETLNGIIVLDVGAHFKPKNVSHSLALVSYQWWLVLTYFVSKLLPRIGDRMSVATAAFFNAPQKSAAKARMNYPYFYFWRARFCKEYRAALPIRYRPQKPLLYLYGKLKKFHFHSEKWKEIVNNTPGSRSAAVEHGGHWFLLDDAQTTNTLMDTWLKERRIERS